MKRSDKEKCKQILFACAQMIGTLEMKMSIEEASKLIQIRDGLSVVHTKLSEEKKEE